LRWISSIVTLRSTGAQDVGQAVLRQIQRDLAPHQTGEGEKPRQRAFQHAHVGGDPVREELQHAVRDDEAAELAGGSIPPSAAGCRAAARIGRMQVDDQPALQAALDPVLHVLDLARRAVGRDDDLLVLVDERVEGVEELFLRAVLAGDELHVIDHQHVDRPEQLLERP
jgi:hypothetical protein